MEAVTEQASGRVAVHPPEKRARMRASERKYLESNPERYQAKLERNRNRYASDPEFRARVIARASERQRRVKAEQEAKAAAEAKD